MATVKALYVSQHRGIHELVGGVVRAVTGGRYSHAALIVDFYGTEYIVEAVGSHVGLTPGNYFDNDTDKVIYEIPVTDDQLNRIRLEALRVTAARPHYGLLTDCLASGVSNLLGDEAGEDVATAICNSDSMDCSRFQTHLLRQAYPGFAKGRSASIIDPDDAEKLVRELIGLPEDY